MVTIKEDVIKLGEVILYSTIIDTTINFYRALGFELSENNFDRDLKFFNGFINDIYFASYPSKEPGKSISQWTGGAIQLCFVVDSLEVSIKSVEESGGKLLISPELQAWGRRAIVLDPELRPIELIENE